MIQDSKPKIPGMRFGPRFPLIKISLLIAFALFNYNVLPVDGEPAVTLNIAVNQPGALVSSNLFGIFFEELENAGDGGLYAEMVRNRAFYDSSTPYYWTFVTQGSATGAMAIDTGLPLNTNLPNSLKLTMSGGSGSVGAANAGYWGMSLQAGATYNLSFYARASSGFSGPLTVRLENASGSTTYAQAAFSGLTMGWQKYSASLVSSATDPNSQLVLSIGNAGSVWLNVISLFPQATFLGRTNGMRLDLANALKALHPSFLRFPGGNYIEGRTLTNAVRWKKTTGDLSQRPGHMNDVWYYWSDDGLGYEEYLQFCEDLGMQPVFAINAGLSLNYNGSPANTVPGSQLGPWVQDALDAIQYANGNTDTTWGAMRAANGHPAPFNLQYMEIGNENGGAYYATNYALFYNAIKSQYPDIQLVSPVWGGIPSSAPVKIQDEHYYYDAATMMSFATKYDGYSRTGPKVMVGEYAVTSAYGTYGNLCAALGEAAFMTGMERNSDLVLMASYAPLFANLNYVQWHPNLIYFNSSGWFGTPSYYVQELFGQNRGDVVLPVNVSTSDFSSTLPHGTIGVGSWNTSVQYTNIVVTSNGVTLYQSDFANQGTSGWNIFNGTWNATGGLYQQTAQIPNCYSLYLNNGNTNWANYTISLQARKVSGNEGFLVLFNVGDNSNWTWWNVGGWNNTYDGIEQMINGSKETLQRVSQTALTTNIWYNLKIVLNNNTVQCYLNNSLIQTLNYPNGIYASATYAKSSGQVIVKAVNGCNQPVTTTLNLTGAGSVSPNATLIRLTSGSLWDENSMSSPTYVFPVTNYLNNAGTNFSVTLPANSLSVFRLNTTGISTYTNLQMQCPAAVTNGQPGVCTVLGQMSGNWINLTANSNHAITYSSSNPNVAIVDANGNVMGINPGTVDIIARYPSLGLSATQTVQVIYQPTLVTWFKADAISGLNSGSGVASWLDSSGHGFNATQSNGSQQPTFVTGAINGYLPAVRFNSANQTYLAFNRPVQDDFTIMFVFQSTQGLNSGNSFYGGAGLINGEVGGVVNDFGTCLFANGSISVGSGNPDEFVDSTAGFNDGQPHIVTFTRKRATGTVSLYVDGILCGTNNLGGIQSLTSPTRLVLGAQQPLYSYLSGDIAEVQVYDAALANNDRMAVENSLCCKYGMGTGTEPPAPSGLNGTAGNRRVVLNWDRLLSVNSYDVLRSTDNGVTYILRAAGLVSTSFTDTGASNGQTNYYEVAAVNNCGIGTNSSPIAVFLPLPTLNFSSSASFINLIWPGWASDWKLYSAPSLVPPINWTLVSRSVTSNNNQFMVDLPFDSSNAFFRLSSQ